MRLHLSYLLISIAYIASPGPAVLFVIANTIKRGFKNSLFIILGNSAGLAFLAVLFSLGLVQLLQAYPSLLKILQVIGALYLAYLALKSFGFFIKPNNSSVDEKRIYHNRKILLKEGFILAATNPKPILFFSAVFPQFLNLENELYLQSAILSVIFISISFLILCLYSLSIYLLANTVRYEKFKPQLDKFFGSVLLIMSVLLFISLFKQHTS